MTTTPAGGPKGMRAVLNALRVLETVGSRQPVGVSELARAVDLPKSSVQRSLLTLAEAGWITAVSEDPTRWALTWRAFIVGRGVSDGRDLRELARPILERLRDATEQSVHLVVPDGDDVVLIERLPSPRLVQVAIPLGVRVPLHAGATGKAVLAALPDDALARRRHKPLERLTEATVVDWDRLDEQLATVRRRGFALNEGEWSSEVVAVGAAVPGRYGAPLGAVSVSAVRHQVTLPDLESFGPLVAAAAGEIAALLEP